MRRDANRQRPAPWAPAPALTCGQPRSGDGLASPSNTASTSRASAAARAAKRPGRKASSSGSSGPPATSLATRRPSAGATVTRVGGDVFLGALADQHRVVVGLARVAVVELAQVHRRARPARQVHDTRGQWRHRGGPQQHAGAGHGRDVEADLGGDRQRLGPGGEYHRGGPQHLAIDLEPDAVLVQPHPGAAAGQQPHAGLRQRGAAGRKHLRHVDLRVRLGMGGGGDRPGVGVGQQLPQLPLGDQAHRVAARLGARHALGQHASLVRVALPAHLPTAPEGNRSPEPLRPAPPASHPGAGELVVADRVLVEGGDRGERQRRGGRARRPGVDQHGADPEVAKVQSDGGADDPAADHGDRMLGGFHECLHDPVRATLALARRQPPVPARRPPRPSVPLPTGLPGRARSRRARWCCPAVPSTGPRPVGPSSVPDWRGRRIRSARQVRP